MEVVGKVSVPLAHPRFKEVPVCVRACVYVCVLGRVGGRAGGYKFLT